MNRIKLHDQQEPMTERMIDTIQNIMNRIKDLEKGFCH